MIPLDPKNKIDDESPAGKRTWEPMELRYVGDIKDVVLHGGGKLSLAGGDPGEGRKQPGGG